MVDFRQFEEAMPKSKESFAAVRFDNFELDLRSGELRKDGTPAVRLPEQSFQILAMLLERAGSVVSRGEIQERLWPDGTVVEFEHSIGAAMNRLRQALGDSAENARYIETLTRRGYRWIAVAEWIPEAASAPEASPAGMSRNLRWVLTGGIAIALLGTAVSYRYIRAAKAHRLTEKDTIVLADLTNMTSESVFDDALRQGLEVQLQQSPFLQLVPDEQIRQTLQMMKQSPEVKLTPHIAREVCQRTNGGAVLESSIAAIGKQYQLILKATSCSTGELLAGTSARAPDKDHILDAIGKVSTDIRSKLGESLTTVQKFDAPLAQATTPSLEALKAYSLGLLKFDRGDDAAAIPLLQKAIELDPDFAMAYLYLGNAYGVLGEYSRKAEPIRKAFALRNRASEHERFEIASDYYQEVSQETDQAIQNCELWEQSYPRDFRPHGNLGVEYGGLAKYERSAEEFRKAIELDPAKALAYGGLMIDLMALDRFADARSVYQDAQAHRVDAGEVERLRYGLAFIEGDAPMMAKIAELLSREPGYEGRVLFEESNTEAYFGRLKAARELSQQSEDKSLLEKDTGTASYIESDMSVREAMFGNTGLALKHAAAAVKLGGDPAFYVMALALAGDTAQATRVVNEIESQTQPGAFMNKVTHAEFRGSIELKRGNAVRALEYLDQAISYEAGWFEGYRPAYVRGEAYLLAHRGQEAATEFQKLIDHRGIVGNQPFGALAHLGLARAYAMQGNVPKARKSYQDFLTLWKDADQDIPILMQAKNEYAQLQ
jgi:eukaryotic-like serine/threonine-protein kinase